MLRLGFAGVLAVALAGCNFVSPTGLPQEGSTYVLWHSSPDDPKTERRVDFPMARYLVTINGADRYVDAAIVVEDGCVYLLDSRYVKDREPIGCGEITVVWVGESSDVW